jgi:hypothetical protein
VQWPQGETVLGRHEVQGPPHHQRANKPAFFECPAGVGRVEGRQAGEQSHERLLGLLGLEAHQVSRGLDGGQRRTFEQEVAGQQGTTELAAA